MLSGQEQPKWEREGKVCVQQHSFIVLMEIVMLSVGAHKLLTQREPAPDPSSL